MGNIITIFKAVSELKVGDIVHGRGIIYKLENNYMYFYSLVMKDLDNYIEMLPGETFCVVVDKKAIRKIYKEMEELIEYKQSVLTKQQNILDTIQTKKRKKRKEKK